MTYPEPLPSMVDLSWELSPSQDLLIVQDPRGIRCEVAFLDGIGWSLESRYDERDSRFQRQPFTGAQTLVRREALRAVESKGNLRISAGSDRLHVSLHSGAFEARCAAKTYWRAKRSPFSVFFDPQQLIEEVQSLDHPDWDEPTPFKPHPTYFSSHMVRFQYALPDGPVLGLPGQCGEFNRRGYRYDLCNTDQPFHVPSRPAMYQSWPIIFHRSVGAAGWVGVFHDNPSRTFVDLGDFYSDTVTFESVAGNTRVYIVYGKTLRDVSARLSRLLGASAMPPAWAFGYQQCRYSYMSSTEVRHVAAQFRKNEIPCDAIYFDIDYMDGYRVFTRNAQTFSDLSECVTDLSAQGIQSICIIDPGIKEESGYAVYDRFSERRELLTDGDGAALRISCWPGAAVLPDFYNENARALWADLQSDWLRQYPFAGVWNDMNEPANFDGGRYRTEQAIGSAGPIRPQYNLYGYRMAQASAEGFHRLDDSRRPFVITRSGYPGVQQYAVIWHGDNHAWWEHIRLAVDTALSYSLCGALYTGADVPGFFGNLPEDLAIRYFQMGAFLPFFRGHSYKLSDHKEPYAYSEATAAIIRDAIRLRYSLAREWYSGFERARREGGALMHPVFLPNGDLQRDAFLLFDTLMVLPVTTRNEQARAVYLPRGDWYRLGAPKKMIPGGRWVIEPISLDRIPVFVRAGTILTRAKAKNTFQETLKGPERFEVYPTKAGKAEGYWYDDDGVSLRPESVQRWRLRYDPRTRKIERISI